MKTLNEYINESLINEAKEVKVNALARDIEKIRKWNKADNIKNLEGEYMSAGDNEELGDDHYNICVDVITRICDSIDAVITVEGGKRHDSIDLGELSEHIAASLEAEDGDEFIKYIDKNDPDYDWDVDVCFDLFNMVSQKVCRQSWLVD